MACPQAFGGIRRAGRFALFVGLAQAIVFGAGWILLFGATHTRVTSSVEDVILSANAAATRSIADALGAFPTDLTRGSSEWERAQAVVEAVELPAGGFACVIDENGFIACHPDIVDTPSLGEIQLGKHVLNHVEDDGTTVLTAAPEGVVTTGTMSFAIDGTHFVSTIRDGASGAQLVVHQPVTGLTAAAHHATGGILGLGFAVGAVICGLTTLLGFVLVRAHNREIVCWNETLEDRVEDQASEIRQAHRCIIFGIAKLAEYRDNETGMHVERVCAYTGVLAKELARRGAPIDDEWIDQVRLAASLHDIGKVSIPDAVLLKPGRLTEGEFDVMKTHAATGRNALEAVRKHVGRRDELLELGIEISGGHHEKWNGGGYPVGLEGEDIPLSARIVAVADVFDALMSKRVYKPAIPFEEVVAIIEDGRGEHFDPAVVDAFHAVSGELRAIRARLSDVEDVEPPTPHRENLESGALRLSA
ncbi:MAG: HD domain-containing phosphohydrolase [Planctomycetota bacterium]